MAHDKLVAALPSLTARGFLTGNWYPEGFVALRVDVTSFVEDLHNLTKHGDEIVGNVLASALDAQRWWTSVATCTLKQMFDFLSWLKQDEGKRLIGKATRRRIVEKLAKDGQSCADAALQHAFDEQIKLLNRMKRLHLSKRERLDGAYRFKKVREDLLPAGSYKGPLDSELPGICVTLHLEKFPEATVTTDDEIELCKYRYKSQAKKRHKIMFLETVEVRQQLVKWILDYIVHLGNNGGTFGEIQKFVAFAEAVGSEIDDDILFLLEQGRFRRAV